MRRCIVPLLALVASAAVVLAGCAQTAPPSAPTQPPAAPTKAAEPTKAPEPVKAQAEPTKAVAAQPTAVPVKKLDFPAKDKVITINCPWPAGGNNDIVARILAAEMEKDLQLPVRVENKSGASGQVGLTAFVQSKPDGYTLAMMSLPSSLSYLDPERKAVFGRKDLLPVAMVAMDAMILEVKGDGPYKTPKDLLDAAKAKPETIKLGDPGIASAGHLSGILLQKVAGVKFSIVHFDGDPQGIAALVGGHIDAFISSPASSASAIKSGAARVLGHSDSQEAIDPLPGVKSMKSQGYDWVFAVSRGFILPAGTPKEIQDFFEGAIKKVTEKADFKKKAEEAGTTVRYLNAAQYAAHWDEVEKQVAALLPEAK